MRRVQGLQEFAPLWRGVTLFCGIFLFNLGMCKLDMKKPAVVWLCLINVFLQGDATHLPFLKDGDVFFFSK